ncbi:uncharacterized protein LOC108105729, partial [Drosophila eugracilis]|uniref:uncharacterized protein LOC108105729 n=1 Tax=Drosophila eugracilis TaxID=29029 RepID=UPI001BDB257C
ESKDSKIYIYNNKLKSQLLLVATVTIATALVFPGSSYRYSCNWNTGQYKCTHVRCSHSFDGKENCSTSVTSPNVSGGPRIISMGTPVTNRYSCDWNTGSYKCTHTHCIHYHDGNKNCTTKVTTRNN